MGSLWLAVSLRSAVCLDAVTGFDGNEGGGDDIAPDTHLKETPGDPKAASTRFITNVEVAEFAVLILGDSPHRSFDGMLGGGDGAVVPGLGVTIIFKDGDDGFCFMNVESEVKSLRCG